MPMSLCPQCGEQIVDGYIINSDGEILCCKDCLEDMTPIDIAGLFGGVAVEC
jgi:uncharacterized radical SAM superfamily Fe-S cluster-containing enzyme